MEVKKVLGKYKIITKIDCQGRVTLPKTLRDLYNLHHGDLVELIYMDVLKRKKSYHQS